MRTGMPRHTLSACLLLLPHVAVRSATTTAAASAASASVTPLVDKTYTYPNVPYQVDPVDGDRGPQSGYNICNSTTEGASSFCQTMFVNSLDDFCLWGPATANSTISDTEGQTVAWCSKPGHGTRVMPAGTITAAQFLKAPSYIQVTGLINQVNIDMTSDDDGGELDPHGADLRGNPIGALMYSNGFPSNDGNNSTYQQVIEWHNFMGSSIFCIKACDPSVAGSTAYCQNIFDRIGCEYNAPASYTPDEFTVCDSDNQDPPGIYTDAAGAVQTYTQPAESLGAITSMPYNATIPATSNCVTYTSAVLYASESAAASTTASGSAAAATATGTTSSKASSTIKASSKTSGSTITSTSTSTSASSSNGASRRQSAGLEGQVIALALTLSAGFLAAVCAAL